MKYDELLNHKTILDCENPRDEEQHGKDVEKMFGKMGDFGLYGAIVKVEPVDKAHKKKGARYQVVGPDEYGKAEEGCDFKNGSDMVVHNGLVGTAVYGACYTMGTIKKEGHMVETLCSYRFLNEKADLERLEDMDQEELKREFEKGVCFLDTKDFIWDMRSVKRKELDVLIREAEVRCGRKPDGGKGKEKDKEKGPEKE